MLKSPCDRRCEDKVKGCRANCKRYRDYEFIVGESRDRRAKFHEAEEMLYGSHRNRR